MNESVNDKPVYRTAPATPGLLIMNTFCLINNEDKSRKSSESPKKVLRISWKSCADLNIYHLCVQTIDKTTNQQNIEPSRLFF